MARILIVTDKENSAIDILSKAIQRYASHHKIDVCDFHPKRPSLEQLNRFKELADKADIIHYAYWKTAEKVREMCPEFSKKKSMLTHHNPYDLDKKNWADEYDLVVVKNDYQKSVLPYAYKIPHTVDLNKFVFNNGGRAGKPTVLMVASRIEASKGIKEVAAACKRIGCVFNLVGRISDKNYFDEIRAEAGEFNFLENISEKSLIKQYQKAHVLVVNSKDDFESGPLPALEAMACGTPVVTRKVGMIPDIYDGKNMIVRDGAVGDIDELSGILDKLLESGSWREQLANAAFGTIKNRPHEISARMYSKLYYQLFSKRPLVSIVLPTFNRGETLLQVLLSLKLIDYENKEVIICDDSSTDDTFKVVANFSSKFDLPIKYVNTGRYVNQNGQVNRIPHYGIAEARNRGIVEAEGQYIMFLDDRLIPDRDSLTKMVDFIEKNTGPLWVYGVKDNAPKAFVENFSLVERSTLVRNGMMNERIDAYGGMSQEIRQRFGAHGVKFVRVEDALAKSFVKSRRWHDRKQDLVRAKLTLFKLYE